jgi:hypothetical protein
MQKYAKNMQKYSKDMQKYAKNMHIRTETNESLFND